MWGPSIPICRCVEWLGIRALQYGYGDENNSIPIIGGSEKTPTSLENFAEAYQPEHDANAVLKRMTGRLRWAPWLLCSSMENPCIRSGIDMVPPEASGELKLDTLPRWPAARAQRLLYESDRQHNQSGALLFHAEKVHDGSAPFSYFSAYLWLMFVVCRKPTAPGLPPRRLSDDYPTSCARGGDRIAKRLWRELLPVYVHANIADPQSLELHRRTLVNNTIGLLRQIWVEQSRLFLKVDHSDLCFCLVGGSDYSGCGSPLRFPPCNPLVHQLRKRLAEEPDRELADAILLPPDDETPANRPRELALFYSTCHLADLVADYYSYVDSLARE